MIVVAGIMSDFEGIGHCMLSLQEAAASHGQGGEKEPIYLTWGSCWSLLLMGFLSCHTNTLCFLAAGC
jgi:hypothetical protein